MNVQPKDLAQVDWAHTRLGGNPGPEGVFADFRLRRIMRPIDAEFLADMDAMIDALDKWQIKGCAKW